MNDQDRAAELLRIDLRELIAADNAVEDATRNGDEEARLEATKERTDLVKKVHRQVADAAAADAGKPPDPIDDPALWNRALRKNADPFAVLREAVAVVHLPEPLIGDDWDRDPPDREWLVHEWLPAGELALFTGPGSVGKGVFALQLSSALACDRDPLQKGGNWLPKGKSIKATPPELSRHPVNVVIAAWEDAADEILRRRNRLAMYGNCPWIRDPSIRNRLHVLPMRGYGPVWAPEEGRHTSTVGAMTETGQYLLHYCRANKAKLLVIDPAGLAICTNENDRALVSMALDALAGWAMRTGCTVLIIGHPAKATEGEAADYSGSTAWRGSVRALWTLRAPDAKNGKNAKPVRVPPTEYRTGRKYPERLALWSRNKNNYGFDGDALTVTTCGGRAGWALIDTQSDSETAYHTEDDDLPLLPS